MITLTLLNGKKVVVNADYIKMVTASPDTIITFINGEKLMVKESVEEVVEKVLTYKRLTTGFYWQG